ncbi:MAG: DUF2059 domain-containing protein [Bacteroides sp.]|nr:DUF2059 domain-containing protein [Bacteroides sp.]MCM1412898.1 DUF2059 domain-containing protein [Bacteroides sp.]MCM1471567.1 DUF2059 domain-containing protein [Bacteroides sp.]
MKRIQHVIILLILAMAPVCCMAQSAQSDGYATEVYKVLETSNTKANMIASTWKNMNLPFNCEAAAKEVVDDIWPDLVKDLTAEYRKYFTLADLKAINQFYASPAGRKFAKYSSAMATAIQQIIQQKYQTRMINILTKYMQK